MAKRSAKTITTEEFLGQPPERMARLTKLRRAFYRGATTTIEGITFDFRALADIECGLASLEEVHLNRLDLGGGIKNFNTGIFKHFGLSSPPCLNLPWLEAAPIEALKPSAPPGFGCVSDSTSPIGMRATGAEWNPEPYDLSALTRVLKGDKVIAEWVAPRESSYPMAIEAEKRVYRFKFVVWRKGAVIGESQGDLDVFPKAGVHRHWYWSLALGFEPSSLSFLDIVHERIDLQVEPSRKRAAIEADIIHLRQVDFETEQEAAARRKRNHERLQEQIRKLAEGTHTPWDGLDASRDSFLHTQIDLKSKVDDKTWLQIEEALNSVARIGYDLRVAEESEKLLPEALNHQARRSAGSVGGKASGIVRGTKAREWKTVAQEIVTKLQADNPSLTFARCCALAVKPLAERGFTKKARTIERAITMP